MSATQTEWAGGPDPELKLVLPGRTRPAGAGWTWIVEGWKLFVKAPVMWIVAVVVLFIAALVMSLVPFIGSLAYQLLNPVIAAGLVVACRSLERGGELELEHLLAGFKHNFANLLLVGVITVVVGIAILLVFGAFVGFSILAGLIAGNLESMTTAAASSVLVVLLGTLVVLALMVPLMMAYWFAPALVILNDMKPVDAMKASFMACLHNVVPFLVYGLITGFLAFLALLPVALGFLVWIPVTIASSYAAYRDIFTEPAATAS